ncbi:MAG: AAA family ATPase [Acidimicrobiia bacterium]|nr:AAA family ATPase [Acidimicrobiia bacterium]MYC44518.1 AAA family ATPase [Acidimicrobiia bacterium]
MSALLRVERLEIPQWGRASGFDLDLSTGNFLVLFGPNESGKSSAATALAWLVAGPGKQRVLQRFGSADERLRARLQGILGSERLAIDVRAKVTAQSPGASARETLEATIGESCLSREELSHRLGGGDFSGYQRLYWVEALQVAEGNDLQENVSVQAMFGGVNPFAEADSLSDKALELLGSSRGRARSGSTRALYDQVRAIEVELQALPDSKREWSRIEQELADKAGQVGDLRRRIDEIEGALRSVELSVAAINGGLVATLRDTRAALARLPEPSPEDSSVHRQASFVRSKIGDLDAAERQCSVALKDYEDAHAALHEDWRSVVGTGSLGEAGIDEAAQAETHLKLVCGDLATAEEEVTRNETVHGSWQERYEELLEEWNNRAPETLDPEDCVSLTADVAPSAEPVGVAAGITPSRLGGLTTPRGKKFVPPSLGTVIAIAVAVLSAVQENWIAVALAGVGALALASLVVRLIRSRSMSAEAPDAAVANLAARLLKARGEHDDSARRLTEARGEESRQRRRAEAARTEYRRRLGALGVPAELVERFEPAAVQQLKVVRSVQSASAVLERARGVNSDRLGEVKDLLATAVEQADAARRDDSGTPGGSVPVAGSLGDAEADAAPLASGALPHGTPRDAAEAGLALEAACERVDARNMALESCRHAEDNLNRALQYDEAALGLIGEITLEALLAKRRAVQSERGDLTAQRDVLQQEIDELRDDRRDIEAPDNQRVELVLQRGELVAQVEDGLVRGLGHHLAAQLLQEAAEQHRRTQQPELLRRTQELAGEVADDWLSVTVNPHASSAAGTSGRHDALLVASPRGEYPAERLSFGAQSLLYLTLRLATIEEQSKTRGVRLPLILDDVLVGLDDERAMRCLRVLADFATNHQILLLTCHERTAARARSAGAEILEILPR